MNTTISAIFPTVDGRRLEVIYKPHMAYGLGYRDEVEFWDITGLPPRLGKTIDAADRFGIAVLARQVCDVSVTWQIVDWVTCNKTRLDDEWRASRR